MTAVELIHHFNTVFNLNEKWPATYEVDAETYANCCQYMFNQGVLNSSSSISLGLMNSGLMFKNVELILKGNHD